MTSLLKIEKDLKENLEEFRMIIAEEKTFNFISSTVDQENKELFFGPINDTDDFIIIEDNWLMAHVFHACGIFKSVSQARKNGGNAPIPPDFSIITRGKKAKKCNIFILNL